MTPTRTPLTRHLEIEALREAVSWPNVAQRTVLILAVHLLAEHRYREGYEYFGGRSSGGALFLALAGAFQARLGEDLEGALAKLDAATEQDLGLPHYFRGITLGALPDCGGRAEAVVADLEFVLLVKDQFPPGFMRAVYRSLAAAYKVVGREDEVAAMLEQSGPTDIPLLMTDYWANAEEGFHLVPPRLAQLAPDVYVAQGYDFSDIGFVVTGDGVVAVDAGTNQHNAQAALRALRTVTDLPLTHVILTHAHFDHIGGVAALREAGTRVIAQAGFPGEQALQNASPAPAPYLLPRGESHRRDVKPDLLVSGREAITIGGTDFVFHAIAGGETLDGLMIHLPARGVLFVGDMIMPQLGVPSFPEGSAQGLLDAMELVLSLQPDLLIHGHSGLTENFPIASMPGLLAALSDLYDLVRAQIADSRSLVEILHRNHLPAVLRDHPAVVVPYLVVRDGFIQRVYHQNVGYWRPGDEDTARILSRLLERYQLLSPFKFIHYAGLARLDLPPVR